MDPQWQLASITMKSGESKAGFIVERNLNELKLKMAGGLTEVIPNAKVKKTTVQRISVMPEGLLQSLTAQEAADLLAYLGSLK